MSEAQRIEVPGLGEPHPEGTALFLIVDGEERTGRDSRAAGKGYRLPAGTPYRLIHVMGRWAGGEVRGYLFTDGKLILRQPCYSGDWPELDAAVKAAFDAAGVR